jgi:GNAT superfamily N-acetyltransferase
MPVILSQQHDCSASLVDSLKSIVKDLSAENPAVSGLESWLSGTGLLELWVAVFNERNIGFALISGCYLQAIVVHPVNRNRGVGHRIMDVLITKKPDLQLMDGEQNRWIIDCYHELSSKGG